MNVPRLDPALHHQSRIAIVGRLALHERLRFTDLQTSAGLTAGNLASHLAALEKAGYVTQRDAIVGLRPAKVVALTDAGRAAFRDYADAVARLAAELAATAGPPPQG